MSLLDFSRMVFGVVLLAWLPGYVWTRVLLPRLGVLERFVMSVTLSVALVTLFLYGGNVLFGMRIQPVTAVWGALLFTLAPLTLPLARGLGARLERRVS